MTDTDNDIYKMKRTWFGSMKFSANRLEIKADGFGDDVIDFEDFLIHDVANTHLHVAILTKNGQISWRRIDDFGAKFEFLNFAENGKFLVSTSKNVYLVAENAEKHSEIVKIIDDVTGIQNPMTIQFPWPVRIVGGDGGHDFAIFLDSSGNLFAFGTGTRGELGVGLIRHVDEPVHIEQLAGIRIAKVKCGGWHTVALTEHGDAYTWGWNRCGQLGKEKAITEVYPVLIDPETDLGTQEQDISDVDVTENTTIITIKGAEPIVLGTDVTTTFDFRID